jgi:hypothetical protein
MRLNRRSIANLLTAALLVVSSFGCGENNRNTSPIDLIVTNTQTISQVDLAGGTTCSSTIGTINIQALIKALPTTTLPADNRFNDVTITKYRVTYVRTDGGTQVPAPFLRTTSQLVLAGGTTATLNDFLILQSDALSQAPFVALLPGNGGRDPQTGRPFVGMDVVVELFGQTLAGEDVYGSTRFPLDFCYSCGGCS